MNKDIEQKLEHLQKIKIRFQPFIKNPDIFYTFIAPKNQIECDKFIQIAARKPGFTMSSILKNDQKVRDIIHNYFSDSDDIELYIISDDKRTNSLIFGTVKDYIRKENIEFNI